MRASLTFIVFPAMMGLFLIIILLYIFWSQIHYFLSRVFNALCCCRNRSYNRQQRRQREIYRQNSFSSTNSTENNHNYNYNRNLYGYEEEEEEEDLETGYSQILINSNHYNNRANTPSLYEVESISYHGHNNSHPLTMDELNQVSPPMPFFVGIKYLISMGKEQTTSTFSFQNNLQQQQQNDLITNNNIDYNTPEKPPLIHSKDSENSPLYESFTNNNSSSSSSTTTSGNEFLQRSNSIRSQETTRSFGLWSLFGLGPRDNSLIENKNDDTKTNQNSNSIIKDDPTTIDYTCSICQGSIGNEDNEKEDVQVRILPCLHMFHSDCITSWVTVHSSNCPTCREDLHL